jgi:hypothetical protein
MPWQCVKLLEVEPFKSVLAAHGIKGVGRLPPTSTGPQS